jgi:hypothetical protein
MLVRSVRAGRCCVQPCCGQCRRYGPFVQARSRNFRLRGSKVGHTPAPCDAPDLREGYCRSGPYFQTSLQPHSYHDDRRTQLMHGICAKATVLSSPVTPHLSRHPCGACGGHTSLSPHLGSPLPGELNKCNSCLTTDISFRHRRRIASVHTQTAYPTPPTPRCGSTKW